MSGVIRRTDVAHPPTPLSKFPPTTTPISMRNFKPLYIKTITDFFTFTGMWMTLTKPFASDQYEAIAARSWHVGESRPYYLRDTDYSIVCVNFSTYIYDHKLETIRYLELKLDLDSWDRTVTIIDGNVVMYGNTYCKVILARKKSIVVEKIFDISVGKHGLYIQAEKVDPYVYDTTDCTIFIPRDTTQIVQIIPSLGKVSECPDGKVLIAVEGQ